MPDAHVCWHQQENKELNQGERLTCTPRPVGGTSLWASCWSGWCSLCCRCTRCCASWCPLTCTPPGDTQHRHTAQHQSHLQSHLQSHRDTFSDSITAPAIKPYKNNVKSLFQLSICNSFKNISIVLWKTETDADHLSMIHVSVEADIRSDEGRAAINIPIKATMLFVCLHDVSLPNEMLLRSQWSLVFLITREAFRASPSLLPHSCCSPTFLGKRLNP